MVMKMSDLIDRQAVIDAPVRMVSEGIEWIPVYHVEQLPPAQPKRMKGRWIDVTKTGGAELWKCSECGELELEDSYFCPNCGSDNRGEDDE